MDEVSKRKGHRDFVTVVSDVERGCLIEVIDSHKQQEIIEVLNKQPLEVRACVKEVSVDLWGGFPKIIKEVFPNAAVVFDRFHVMKLVNERLNKIRCLVGMKAQASKYLLLKNQMEGINNKIKLIMRLGYGLHKFDSLRSRLLGCFS